MIVKFCGLTNLDDALAAVDLSADMLGFNFYPPSPRHIPPEKCAEIVSALRRRSPKTLMVGVFVNPDLEEVRATLDRCQLDLAQLCGDEPASMLISLGARAFKAVRPASQAALRAILGIFPLRVTPPAILIDAYRPGEYGGTGQTADWTLAAGIAARLTVLLAGGLTPVNVAQAVTQVRPWGVDVASGIESSPGVKDYQKMQAFISAAHAAG